MSQRQTEVDWRSVLLVVLSGVVVALACGQVRACFAADDRRDGAVAGWRVAGINTTAVGLGLFDR